MIKKLTKQEKVYSFVVTSITTGNSLMIVNALKVRGSLILPIASILVSIFMMRLIKRDLDKQEVNIALKLEQEG
tara:strand:+ start:2359 stop:2580 length:222 start_codon:yes stop_codon:yes gene_type:complete